MSNSDKAAPVPRDVPHAISLSALIASLPLERQRRIEAHADLVLRKFYAAQCRKGRAGARKRKRSLSRDDTECRADNGNR
jgi:hypothetical protein